MKGGFHTEMSAIDDYNQLLFELEKINQEIIIKKQDVSSLQSKRDIYKKWKRETKDIVKRDNYTVEINQINADVKALEREIRELQAEASKYKKQEIKIEGELDELYTPAGTTINADPTAISNTDQYNTAQISTAEPEGKDYSNINNMADAYSGLRSAKDYAVALGTEDKGNLFKSIYHSANIFTEKETDLFHNRYRYGVLNAYQTLTNSKEFLFFTKPDLNIIPSGDINSNKVSINGETIDVNTQLNGVLQNYPFWIELVERYPGVIESLQSSLHLNGRDDPFNHLLANMVQSNIDVPSLSAEMTETPVNSYGVGYTYRGSSEASDDGFDFSLEFKDTKYLPVYNFFKAYEEYETLKHHGTIAPWIGYIYDKILHDQYSIYKFVVGDDGETIIYYAKYYGVKSKSLPRDVFNSNTYDNGLSYSIDFNAAFVEDMNPLILSDFNRLAYTYWESKRNFIDVYDFRYDKADNRPANAAVVVREINGQKGYQIVGAPGTPGKFFYDNIDLLGDGNPKLHTKEPGGFCYKLKWKGDASV